MSAYPRPAAGARPWRRVEYFWGMIAQPKIFLVGGPNGAGKSTFAKKFLTEHPDYIFLNADEIARQISPEAVHDARINAGRTFLTQMNSLRERGANLMVESTLSGVSLAQQIKLFIQAGYYVSLTYVFLISPEMSVSRVAGRVLQGGHHVPTADIFRRFGRSKKNFWNNYRLLADEWQLVLNTDMGFVNIAKMQQHTLTVLDRPIFTSFVREQEKIN